MNNGEWLVKWLIWLCSISGHKLLRFVLFCNTNSLRQRNKILIKGIITIIKRIIMTSDLIKLCFIEKRKKKTCKIFYHKLYNTHVIQQLKLMQRVPTHGNMLRGQSELPPTQHVYHSPLPQVFYKHRALQFKFSITTFQHFFHS